MQQVAQKTEVCWLNRLSSLCQRQVCSGSKVLRLPMKLVLLLGCCFAAGSGYYRCQLSCSATNVDQEKSAAIHHFNLIRTLARRWQHIVQCSNTLLCLDFYATTCINICRTKLTDKLQFQTVSLAIFHSFCQYNPRIKLSLCWGVLALLDHKVPLPKCPVLSCSELSCWLLLHCWGYCLLASCCMAAGGESSYVSWGLGRVISV